MMAQNSASRIAVSISTVQWCEHSAATPDARRCYPTSPRMNSERFWLIPNGDPDHSLHGQISVITALNGQGDHIEESQQLKYLYHKHIFILFSFFHRTLAG